MVTTWLECCLAKLVLMMQVSFGDLDEGADAMLQAYEGEGKARAHWHWVLAHTLLLT